MGMELTMAKVLLVDDSDTWCNTVVAEFGKAGIVVIRARHYDEARLAAQDEDLSLVMVDMLVAARAGAGFVRKLRSLPSLKNTPVLLTTTGTDHSAVHQAMGDSVDEIMSKNRSSLDGLTRRLTKLPLSA